MRVFLFKVITMKTVKKRLPGSGRVCNSHGDIGQIKVLSDLTLRGYSVFIPVGDSNETFDIIAYKDGQTFLIDAKYLEGYVHKDGTHTYGKPTRLKDDIIYAVYCHISDRVAYYYGQDVISLAEVDGKYHSPEKRGERTTTHYPVAWYCSFPPSRK